MMKLSSDLLSQTFGIEVSGVTNGLVMLVVNREQITYWWFSVGYTYGLEITSADILNILHVNCL